MSRRAPCSCLAPGPRLFVGRPCTQLRLYKCVVSVVPLLLLPPVTPSRPPRTRSTGVQVSETPSLRFLYGREANRFLGSDYATTCLRSTTSSTSASSSSSSCPPPPNVLPPRRLRPTRRPPKMPLLVSPSPRLLPGLLEGITRLSRSYLFLY